MIQVLGWICTGLVLSGYILNSREKFKPALIIWCIGDLSWIIYDYFISNWSHAVLSSTIILINIYGIYRKRRKD